MALCTVAEARDLIPGLSGTAEDTILTALVARVGPALARVCGYPEPSAGGEPTMESTSYTLYLDGPSSKNPRVLDLELAPVTAVTSVHDDQDWTYGSGALVASSDYVLDGSAGRLILTPSSSHSWSAGLRNIKVVCTAGFATVPEDLTHAAALTVAHWYRLRHRQGRTSQSSGRGNQQSGPETLPAAAIELLSPFMLARAYF